MRSSERGVIYADALYTRDGLMERLNLSQSAVRSLRRRGLPEVAEGKRKYYLGRHVIDWFAKERDDGVGGRTAD